LDTGNEWGGGTNSLIELLKRLDREKYNISVLFYRNFKKGRDSDIKTAIEGLGFEFMVLESPRPFIKNLVKEAVRPFLWRKGPREAFFARIDYRFRVNVNARRITGIIRERGIDLLYMNNQPKSNLEGIIAARDAGIKCLQHVRIRAGLSQFEVDAVNGQVTRLICVSEGVKDDLLMQGVDSRKMTVVYNGIDPASNPRRGRAEVRSELGVGEDEVLVGSAGTLTGRKLFGDLITAVSKIKDLPLKGVVVGDGPDKNALKAGIARAGLDSRFLFPGFKDDPLSYINAMDIFVLPSKREGLPRVILEAMLLGKPVVACRIPGPTEQVVHGVNGYLYEVGDTGALAEYISGLASSTALRERMGAAGRRTALEKFSMDAYVRGVSRILDETLE
ncbi:MAG: glycosyltransferase, partial [Nitrospirota bacterium]